MEDTTGAEIGPFGAEAFMDGYTKHGTPQVNERAWKCSHLLLQFAEDNYENPDILGFVESQAELEGLYNQIFVRRDHLWQSNDILIRTWAKKLSLVVPYERLLAAASTPASNRDAVKAAIVVVLLALLAEYPKLASELRAIATQASSESQAEGIALAAALLAVLRGNTVPDLQQLAAASLKKIKHDTASQQGITQHTSSVVDGMAGDLADSLSPGIRDGSSTSELSAKARDAIAAGNGPAFYTDAHIQAALVLATVSAYRRAGIGSVNFLTMGDSKVCGACIAAESGGPYPITDVPEPPLHGGCRCVLSPS